MPDINLPAAFVWTKMGAESGEALAAIIRRKDYERQLGSGMFAWGIGNALGHAVGALAAKVPDPQAVFCAMPSKPTKEDAQPASVLLWTAYEDHQGVARPLPAHMVITSRGHTGGSDKLRHYALFCHSKDPLLNAWKVIAGVAPAALRNFSTGNALGASQVTAVVQCAGSAPAGSRIYPVAFMAALAGARYARLLAPRTLSTTEVADLVTAAQGGLDAWARFTSRVRQTSDVLDPRIRAAW